MQICPSSGGQSAKVNDSTYQDTGLCGWNYMGK
jgi:hypothetical protein